MCAENVIRFDPSGAYMTFQIVLMRYAFGFVFLSPWIARTRPRLLPDRQFWYHAQRSGLTDCGLFASYYSVTVIALADSLALQFTLPVFTSLLAIAFLGEWPPSHRWIAIMAGFAGAIVILRPGLTAINIGMLVAVLAAALYGASDVTTRYLSRTSLNLGYRVLWLRSADFRSRRCCRRRSGSRRRSPIGRRSPPSRSRPFASQRCLTHAYGKADTSMVSPVLFARLPFAAAMTWFFFSEATDLWTWAGAALIFAGTTWSARQEARLMRKAASV